MSSARMLAATHSLRPSSMFGRIADFCRSLGQRLYPSAQKVCRVLLCTASELPIHRLLKLLISVRSTLSMAAESILREDEDDSCPLPECLRRLARYGRPPCKEGSLIFVGVSVRDCTHLHKKYVVFSCVQPLNCPHIGCCNR